MNVRKKTVVHWHGVWQSKQTLDVMRVDLLVGSFAFARSSENDWCRP